MTAAFFGELKRARRTFIKDSERSLLIEDDIEKSDTVDLITWQLITQADVEILLGGAILKQDGKQLSLEVASHPELMPSVVSLNPPPLELDTMKDGLKRLELRFPAWTIKKDTLSIRVRLSGESL